MKINVILELVSHLLCLKKLIGSSCSKKKSSEIGSFLLNAFCLRQSFVYHAKDHTISMK